jgi:hypothetical protein
LESGVDVADAIDDQREAAFTGRDAPSAPARCSRSQCDQPSPHERAFHPEVDIAATPQT